MRGLFMGILADVISIYSFTGTICALRADSDTCDGHVDLRRTVDLWDHHKLYDVLSGRAGLLKPARDVFLYGVGMMISGNRRWEGSNAQVTSSGRGHVWMHLLSALYIHLGCR